MDFQYDVHKFVENLRYAYFMVNYKFIDSFIEKDGLDSLVDKIHLNINYFSCNDLDLNLSSKPIKVNFN